MINYEISEKSFVTINIYDVLGNKLYTIISEEKPAGNYEVTLYAGNLPSGVYFYQMRAGDYVQSKKMILMK
jgi:hypothetical protein